MLSSDSYDEQYEIDYNNLKTIQVKEKPNIDFDALATGFKIKIKKDNQNRFSVQYNSQSTLKKNLENANPESPVQNSVIVTKMG